MMDILKNDVLRYWVRYEVYEWRDSAGRGECEYNVIVWMPDGSDHVFGFETPESRQDFTGEMERLHKRR